MTFLWSLAALRQKLPELSNEVLNWTTIGNDGLYSSLPLQDNLASKTLNRIVILINRSRSLSMTIEMPSSDYLFLLGELDFRKKILAPQSIVLYKH